MYSMKNNDVFSDSGTASKELKINVLANAVSLALLLAWMLFHGNLLLVLLFAVFGTNLFINRKLLKAFYAAKGPWFSVRASLYYTLVYPVAVAAGSFTGVLRYRGNLRRVLIQE